MRQNITHSSGGNRRALFKRERETLIPSLLLMLVKDSSLSGRWIPSCSGREGRIRTTHTIRRGDIFGSEVRGCRSTATDVLFVWFSQRLEA